MEASHIADEQLHLYVDGELTPEGAAEVASHLERCPACGARRDSLAQLRRHIGIALEESTRGVDFEALFARVERGIAPAQTPKRRGRASHWLRQNIGQHPDRMWMSAAGLLVAAAGLLLLVRDTSVERSARESGISATIDIEQVAFNDDYGGTVFEVALADGASTKVVWINDYEDDDDEVDHAY